MSVHREDDTVRTRVLTAALALLLGLAPLIGCESGNDSEWQRVVCEVELVNEGAPLVSAYVVDGGDGIIGFDPLTGTSDDTFPFDQIAVSFRARPYSVSTMTIPEDSAYSSFIITGYNLVWRTSTTNPDSLDLTQYNVTNGSLYLQVPINADAVSAVMVVDRAMKGGVLAAFEAAWYADPGNLPGSFPGFWTDTQDFTAIADLQFIGHDSGSRHETVINSGVGVTFTYALAAN
ncbi:hypothetical protein DRQ50_02980 [bacterium]|nr:MAG: hypothetical protein DRQ50_02980 [bacterium]